MKRNTHINWLFKSATIACLVLGYASCADDEEVASLKNQGTSEIVSFDISTMYKFDPDVIGDSRSVTEEETTSNAIRTEAIPMESDIELPGEQIYMYVIEEDCPAVVDTMQVNSRTAEGETTKTPVYGIYAYDVNQNLETYPPVANSTAVVTPFMSNIALDSDKNYINNNEVKYWPGEGHWLKFYAYSPYYNGNSVAGLLVESASNNQPQITYEVPEHGSQVDLLGGAASNLYDGSVVGNKVNITLSHLLSQIVFKVGTIDVGTITEVRLKNIASKGSLVLGSTEWTLSKDVNGKIIVNDYRLTEDKTNDNKGQTYSEKPFYFIPQSFEEDAIVEIDLLVEDAGSIAGGTAENHTFTLSKKLKDLIINWQPNKKYTYVLSTPEEVEVEVTDEVVGLVKQNLVITNIGLADAYIRVSITGSWIVESNITIGSTTTKEKLIVGDWKEAIDEFNWGATGTPSTSATQNKWRKGTDGYYYYMERVPRGTTLNKLFETYTLRQDPPMNDAYLQLTILAQAILADDVKFVWPTPILNELGITPPSN